MRVLHVIDADRPLMREFARPSIPETFDDRALSCRAVIAAPGHDHRVCIVGSAVAVRRAARLGLPVNAVIPSMLGRSHLSVARMGELIRSVRPDMVHWWHRRWTGGVFGRPGRAWRLEAALGTTPMKLPLWLSRAGAMVCGQTEEACARAAGLQPFAAPSPAFPARGRSEQVPDTVLLLGPDADAREFLFMCGLIWGAGTRIAALIPATARALDRTRRVGRTFQYPVRIQTSDLPRHDLLARCTAAVWMGPAKPGSPSPAVSIASALASGLPVAVPFAVEWALPPSIRPLMVARNSTPNELARVLMSVLADRGASPAIGEARLEAARLTRGFVAATLAAYEGQELAGRSASGALQSPAA